MLILYSLAKQGVKEEPAKPTEVRIAGKAGWLKKSSGKFLSSYKDRYIHLDQTVIEVYENEVSLLNHDETTTSFYLHNVMYFQVKYNIWKSIGPINSLVTDIIQNNLFCVQQTKETYSGLEQH